jgi:hypothetical protein
MIGLARRKRTVDGQLVTGSKKSIKLPLSTAAI